MDKKKNDSLKINLSLHLISWSKKWCNCNQKREKEEERRREKRREREGQKEFRGQKSGRQEENDDVESKVGKESFNKLKHSFRCIIFFFFLSSLLLQLPFHFSYSFSLFFHPISFDLTKEPAPGREAMKHGILQQDE